MRSIKRFFCIVIIPIFIFISFTGCKRNTDLSVLSFNNISFRDIPGITQYEINAIEELQRQRQSFIYAMAESAEAFNNTVLINEVIEGEIGGFSALFCEWLTDLFGIQFDLQLVSLDQLLILLISEIDEIDFWGDFQPTEERRQNFFMSEPIALRWLKSMRITGSQSFNDIITYRPVRFAFLQNTVAIDDIAAIYEPGTYEAIILSNFSFDDIYQILKRGEADAFIVVNPVESAFDHYVDIYSQDFLPLVFSEV
jgi:hypothetical protein